MRKKDVPLSPLGALIKPAMDARGLIQADLARASGVSESQIGRWLYDPDTRPAPVNLRKAADSLGLRVIDLVIACGHLTPAEVGMTGPVTAPTPPEWTRESVLRLVASKVPDPDLGKFAAQAVGLAWDAATPDLVIDDVGVEVDNIADADPSKFDNAAERGRLKAVARDTNTTPRKR